MKFATMGAQDPPMHLKNLVTNDVSEYSESGFIFFNFIRFCQEKCASTLFDQ